MSASKDEKRSAEPHRGLRFFFWVSVALFVVASANWIFNDFIGISIALANFLGTGSATYWVWSAVILMLAIILVAQFLNLTYTFVPNVRLILNGVLGLDKAEPCPVPQTTKDAEVEATSDGNREPIKEIELKKIDLISEELRTRYYTALGLYFSVLIIIITSLFSIGLALTNPTVTLFLFALVGFPLLLIVGLLDAVLILRTAKCYSHQLDELDKRIGNLERGERMGTVREELRQILGRE
jgi:hypothetical protein